MHRILIAAVLVISLLEHSNGYCCFRDPLMLAPKCSCPDFYAPSGVVKCSETCANPGPKSCGCSQTASKSCGCSQPASKSCGCSQPAYKSCGCSQSVCSNACSCQPSCTSTYDYAQYLGPNICECGIPACSCYRDTSNVCYVCDEPSPMCSCLKAANKNCGCSKAKSNCGCGCEDTRSFVYFPEVEYPLVALDLKPYYYGGCYNY